MTFTEGLFTVVMLACALSGGLLVVINVSSILRDLSSSTRIYEMLLTFDNLEVQVTLLFFGVILLLASASIGLALWR